MLYNESEYNGDSYNLTNYDVTLAEVITPTDATLTKDIFAIRTESQGTADALGGSASLQAFLETVTIYQKAYTPFAYNNGMYNAHMYNVRADEDEILLMAIKALNDTITATDVIGPFDIEHLITEIITGVDTTTFDVETSLFEVLFLDESHRIEITNKAINDTLHLADWLSIERKPAENNWYD